ncbi:helix-turn-helix domain-containing protein [Kordia sp. TARA_039_SRF]|nr:helix-turn-helix domain-containing protein [Kordia sp. TARA_039_SRF]
MAKEAQKTRAKELYIQGNTNKLIAEKVGVTQKTISSWIKKFNWEAERNARLTSKETDIENIKLVISKLISSRIQITKEIEKAKDVDEIVLLEKKGRSIADEISKYNKTLESYKEQNTTSLATYLQVMDHLFDAIKNYNENIYLDLLDFQDSHLTLISQTLG